MSFEVSFVRAKEIFNNVFNTEIVFYFIKTVCIVIFEIRKVYNEEICAQSTSK